MGTWGAGTMDSDAAWEYLYSVVLDAIKDIVFWLAPENQELFAIHGVFSVAAAVDIVVRVLEHYGLILDNIEPPTVQQWRTVYLERHDTLWVAYHREIQSKIEHKVPFNRELVIQTFDKFEAITQKWLDDYEELIKGAES